MQGEPIIRIEHLSKRFRIYHRRNQTLKQTVLTRRRSTHETLWALRDVSLEVERGATLGIVGANGSGKSTLLKCIAGILKPEHGSVHVDGRIAALLELGAGFHPEYTGRENIYLNGALLGLSRRDTDAVLDDIIEFSELSRFIDNAVKTYSSGMYARLGFSIAVHLNPDVLAVDEILAVGDEAFQRRCYERLDQMKAEGKTMVLVSHALTAIREHCKTCIWLDAGQVRGVGPVDDVVSQYLAEVRAQEAVAMAATVAEVHTAIAGANEDIGVSEVVLSGPSGPGHVFETGSDFEIQIGYHSPGPELRGARFSVELAREDGVLAFSTSTENSGLGVLPGTGVVTLRLPEVPLLGGKYYVSITIADAETNRPYTVLVNAFPFVVNSGAGPERGISRFKHEWRMPLPTGQHVRT